MKKIAVILSGCGYLDGAEINEAVLTLLALDNADAQVECFAPDIEQRDVVNHVTEKTMSETRNTLVESARICRGQITDLKMFQASEFDALILPGGFGAAKNLSDFALKGASCTINSDVISAISQMHRSNKPVGFICIAPHMIPLIYPKGAKLTVGNEPEVSKILELMGATHKDCATQEIVVDETNKVVTTPAYMCATRLKEANLGITKLVKKILELT